MLWKITSFQLLIYNTIETDVKENRRGAKAIEEINKLAIKLSP
jgi:hypothetical protein